MSPGGAGGTVQEGDGVVARDGMGGDSGRVAAVVVAWGQTNATISALESLSASTIPLEPLLCVAQQYQPEQLARLASAAPGAEVMELADNLGFAGAANRGIHLAVERGARWVLLMNNDATADPACAERCLAEVARHEQVAAVGPAVAYAGNGSRLWFAGARHSQVLDVVWHRGPLARPGEVPPSADSDYVPGCCVLLSAVAWRQLGSFREDYFMYFEDVEWGERARLAGWRLRYLGEVLCHHSMALSSGHGEGSLRSKRLLSETSAYYLARNPLRHARETPGAALRLARTAGALGIWTAYNLTRVRPTEWPTVGRAMTEGLRDGWSGRMGPRPATPRGPSRTGWSARTGRREATLEEVDAGPPAAASQPGGPSPLAGARVCVVYDCLFPWTIGGAERWYRLLAERLAAAGASVTYLTRRQWEGAAPDIEGVDVVAVSRGDLYHPDGKRRNGPPLRFGAGVLWWLARHRHEVRAVHVANFPYFSLIGARVALLGTGTHLYVDWFEVWPLAFWRRYAGGVAGPAGFAIQRLCVALSPHALAFWGHTAERLSAQGHRGRITVLPGLLPARRPGAAAALLPSASPAMVFAGRFIRDKGVRLLPEALEIARRDVPRLRLVLAGEGPERAAVEHDLSRLGLDEAAELAGKLDDGELERLVAAASCVVVASVREGYGMMVVEAAALGTPAIVAANPENAAVGHIVDGVNGFVVEPTASGLAAGVVRAVRAGATLRESTRAWYERAAASASAERSAAEVVAIYAADGVGSLDRRSGR